MFATVRNAQRGESQKRGSTTTEAWSSIKGKHRLRAIRIKQKYAAILRTLHTCPKWIKRRKRNHFNTTKQREDTMRFSNHWGRPWRTLNPNGGRVSPYLWQIVTRWRGESVGCHTSRFGMHATSSHTRKERCGGQYVYIPFAIVMRKFLSMLLMSQLFL